MALGSISRPALLAAAIALMAGPAAAQDQPAAVPFPETTLTWQPGYAAPISETFLVERAEISPDGTRIAYVAALGNTRRVRIEALDGSLTRMADLKDAPLRDIMWAGNDRVIMLMSYDSLDFVPEDNGAFVGVAFNVANNSWEPLLSDRTKNADDMLGGGSRLPDSESIFPLLFERPIVRRDGGRDRVFIDAIETNFGDVGAVCRYNLYETDLDIGGTERVSVGVTRRQARVVGMDNRLAAVMQEGRLKLQRGAGYRLTDTPGEPVELLGLGEDPATVMIRTGRGAEARLWTLRIDGEGEARPVDVADLTAAEPIHDDAGLLIGFEGRNAEGRRAYRFIDRRMTAAWGSILAAFPGDEVRPASWSADYGKIIVYAERAGSSDFHLVDVAAGTSITMAPSYPEPERPQLDRTGNTADLVVRRAAAARIANPSQLCWPPR